MAQRQVGQSVGQWLSQRRAAGASAKNNKASQPQQDQEPYAVTVAKANIKRYEAQAAAATTPDQKKIYQQMAAESAAGIGTHYQTDNPPDFAKAAPWFTYALVNNDVNGAFGLGYLYWTGGNGIQQDRERAKYLWLWCSTQTHDAGNLGTANRCLYWLRQAGVNTANQQQVIDQAIRAAQHQGDAAAGAAILFGSVFAAFTAQTAGKSYECIQYKLAQLAGSPLPPGMALKAASYCQN